MATIQKRTAKDGTISYRVQVRLKGRPSETASFERLTDARKWAGQIEAAIREGRHFKTSESKKHTLGDAIDRYKKELIPHKNNFETKNAYLNYWRETLGDYCLADITTALIVKYRNALVGKKNRYGRTIGTSTANRYMQTLGHILNIAQKEWEWINQNPVSNIKKYKEPRGRVRYLSDEERTALIEACKAVDNIHLLPVVILALSTGARKMEILGLKWQDIDFERGVIILHETKNDEPRVIPLQGYAMELIREHRKIPILGCTYVFPSKFVKKDASGKPIYQPIDIRAAWVTALAQASIKDFRFHDLRHSAASYLAMNGASPAEIAEVLGHKTLQMVKRYAHLSEPHTSTVVAKMNEKIFGQG